jgi:hypothetical protein
MAASALRPLLQQTTFPLVGCVEIGQKLTKLQLFDVRLAAPPALDAFE